MTKLLEQAVEAVRRMPTEAQDAIARFVLDVTDERPPAPIPAEHRSAIDEGLADANRGDFASDADVATAFRRFDR